MKKMLFSARLAGQAVFLAVASCGSSVVIQDPPSPSWLLEGVDGTARQVEQLPPSGSFAANLASVLELAGARPFEIAIARAEAQAQIAAEGEARSRFLPSLRPRAGYFRHEGFIQETGGDFLDVNKQNTTLGSSATLELNPFDAWYRSLAEARRSEASRHGVFSAQQESIQTAIQLYYELLEAHSAIAIAEEAVTHGKEFVAVEEARKKQGVGLEAHVLRAKAHLATSEGELARRKAQLSQASADLSAHLRLPEAVMIVAEEQALVAFDLTGLDGTAKDMFLKALKQRPDLKRAHALVAAAQVDKDRAAYAWILPKLRADSSFDGFGPTVSSQRGRENYSLGLEWELNFGLPFRNQQARAKLQKSQLELEALRIQIRAQILKARARRGAAGTRLAAARREVVASEEARRLVSERHKGGRALLVEVLDAQLANTRSKNGLVAMIAEYNQAQLELKLAMGSSAGKGR